MNKTVPKPTAEIHFSEEDIRPSALMDEAWVTCLVDIGRLLTRRPEFVRVSCPACESGVSHRKFSKNGFDYEQCENCRTFYVNPRPTAEVLEWFYRDSATYAYWNQHIFPASEAKRREKIFVPRVETILDLCARYEIDTGSILEVGAGFGTFCVELKSRGKFRRVVGVELTPALAATCRDRGIEVIEAPIEKITVSSSEKFNVIASFEVIEHLFAPDEFLRHVSRLLVPGGLLALTCPNGEGFDIQTLGALNNNVDHEHLNYFSPSSLGHLLQRCGFEVLDSFTPGRLDAELVRTKVLEGEFDLGRQPFLQRMLVDEWETHGTAFQDFLSRQGLSSSMWIVARKPI